MKKNRIICLFLVFSMLLVFTASCTATPEDEESVQSDESSTEISEDTTDYALIKAQLEALYTEEVDRELEQINISKGKTYTSSIQPSTDYPDSVGGKLTDDTFADSFYGNTGKEPWVGFNTSSGGKLTIELELGQTYTGVADIGISFCNNLPYGIGLPTKVEFYISDGGEYSLIGASVTPKVFDAKDLYTASLRLQGGVSASKIKIVCLGTRSSWLFIDEVFAYKYEGEKTVTNQPTKYYGEVSIPIISESTYWNTSDADYEKVQNLLAKLPQQIISFAALDGNMATSQYNTPANVNTLTDGVYATSPRYSGSGWFRFTRGLARSIIFDLGNTSAVSGFSFGFLKDDESAVRLPASVTVAASENGADWQEIHHVTEINSQKANDIVRVSGNFKGSYRARYIKITFPITSHVYVDELEIMGTKKVGNAKAIVPDPVQEIKYPNKYAAPEDFGNIHDVLLSYICHPDAEKYPPITKEIYLPHVAYIENGEIKDTLFDSFMFLPYVHFLYDYSNGASKKPLKKEDWQYYMDVQYTKDGNMDALEAAVAETKEALGNSDYKVGVFLSLLYPVSTQTAFGEIGGKNLDFSKVQDRKTAIKWLIDEQIRVFKQKGYEHLYIQGFYWFTEEINYGDEQLLDILKFTTDYVRSLNYITSWIPYYQASGYSEWAALGFDLVCYQPNFAFNFSTPDQRLFDAAEAAKLLGMCIELEIGGSSAAHVDRMKKYYAVGALTGYMTEAIHMYYQGGVPGSIYAAYNSEDAYINSLYKDTYKFIKGTFNPDTPAAQSISLECAVSQTVSGSVAVTADNMVKGYTITVSPKYGSVQLNLDGSFTYIPIKGINGNDYFEISVDYGYDSSESAKISIDIK